MKMTKIFLSVHDCEFFTAPRIILLSCIFIMAEHSEDIAFMKEALVEAERAKALGEVPIGAVIVVGGEVIARGHNLKETSKDPTSHAEMVVIRATADKMGAWRLSDSTLYVTLEPCLMCIGAMVQARIRRLVFGTMDPKAGAVGSLYDVSKDERLNHLIDVTSGILAEDCSSILKDFFSKRRQENKQDRKPT